MYDAATHQVTTVQATCRAEGERARVYVADALWEALVDQTQVNGLMHRLELVGREGAVDPTLGIIANTEAVFGPMDTTPMPEGKLDVFILEIGGLGSDAYVCGWCSYLQIHLDGPKLAPMNGEVALSVTSHEMEHIIDRARDDDEEAWVNEALAEASMLANGYMTEQTWLTDHLMYPHKPWGPAGGEVHYGTALVWGAFFLDRGGPSWLTAIVNEPGNGAAGLEAALTSLGAGSLAEVHQQILVSAYLDRSDLGWGIDRLELGSYAAAGSLAPGGQHDDTVQPWAAVYVELSGSGPATIQATSAEPTLRAVAAVQTTGDVVVTPLDGATSVDLGGAERAFVAVTAETVADFTLTMN